MMHPALRLLARVWLATLIVMLIATLAACGGGGDDGTETADGTPATTVTDVKTPTNPCTARPEVCR